MPTLLGSAQSLSVEKIFFLKASLFYFSAQVYQLYWRCFFSFYLVSLEQNA